VLEEGVLAEKVDLFDWQIVLDEFDCGLHVEKCK